MGFPLSYSVKAATRFHSGTNDDSFCDRFHEAFTSITRLQAVPTII